MSSRGPDQRSGYPSGMTVSAFACLLECYSIGLGNLRWTTKETQQLYEEGLIELNGTITEKGIVLAKAIMELPLPVQMWGMP